MDTFDVGSCFTTEKRAGGGRTGGVALSVAELGQLAGELVEDVVVLEDGRVAAVDDLGRYGTATVRQQQAGAEALVLLARLFWIGQSCAVKLLTTKKKTPLPFYRCL